MSTKPTSLTVKDAEAIYQSIADRILIWRRMHGVLIDAVYTACAAVGETFEVTAAGYRDAYLVMDNDRYHRFIAYVAATEDAAWHKIGQYNDEAAAMNIAASEAINNLDAFVRTHKALWRDLIRDENRAFEALSLALD